MCKFLNALFFGVVLAASSHALSATFNVSPCGDLTGVTDQANIKTALAGSDYLYFTAPGDDAQDTSVIINRGTIDVQEYFNEKLREGVIDRIA